MDLDIILQHPEIIVIQFFLIAARLFPVVYMCPFLGAKMAISFVKIGFILFFSFLMFPALHPSLMSISYHKVLFAALLIKEIIIGFIIGFLAQLPFYAFSSLGYFIDIFRGANLIEMLDPYFKQEVSLLGEFYFQLSIIIFLMIDGHHIFLSALANSYVLMPIDSFSLCICSNKLFIDQLIKATYSVIRISLQLGAPFMIVGFMMEILISLLNKISPYFNAFFYGMALKTSVGLLICIMTYYFLQHRIAIEFANALKFLDWLGR